MYSRIRHSAAAGVCCRGPALACVRACGGELAVSGGIIRRLPRPRGSVTTFLLAAESLARPDQAGVYGDTTQGGGTPGISGTLARRRVLASAGAWRGPVERTHSSDVRARLTEPVPVLAAYYDGVDAICRLAAHFDPQPRAAQTPGPEWRAADLAGPLRCGATDFHEDLDEAPVSRYARLIATGAPPDT